MFRFGFEGKCMMLLHFVDSCVFGLTFCYPQNNLFTFLSYWFLYINVLRFVHSMFCIALLFLFSLCVNYFNGLYWSLRNGINRCICL